MSFESFIRLATHFFMKTLKNLAFALGIFMLAVPAFAQVADDYGTANSGSYCPKLSITMQRGARDVSNSGQVSELQKFLSDYYDVDPEEIVTGFFGRITQGYVQKFQREYGLPTFGIAGSMTRAAIAKICTSTTFNTQTSTNTQSTNISTTPISNQGTTEQVKCVFNGAIAEQKCYGYAPSPTIGSDPIYYSCTGVGTCVVIVNGKQNTPITWGSSCGGSANTTIDGNNEYANFNCPVTTQSSATSPFSVDLKVNGSDGPITVFRGSDTLLTWNATEPSQCAVTISRLSNVNWYDGDLENPNKTGSHQTGPINESIKYTISCVDSSSTVKREDSIVINVDEKKPDLVITGVYSDQKPLVVGKAASLSFAVKDLNQTVPRAFTIQLSLNTGGVTQQGYLSDASGETRVTFALTGANIPIAGEATFTAYVDSAEAIAETDEMNNFYHFALPVIAQ